MKAAETLYSAMERIERMALASPQLMTRMSMLPAEKMLAAINPGYSWPSVTSLLDTHLNNGTLTFVGCTSDAPSGVVYGETLNSLYYDLPPVREFRKKNPLSKPTGTRPVLQSLLKAWKEFGGQKQPRIAVLGIRLLPHPGQR